MSHRGHETYERTGIRHSIHRATHGVRGTPSRPHHCQSVQEHHIIGVTPQLTNCMCRLPFQFVLETNRVP